MKNFIKVSLAALTFSLIAGCAPEVGSARWCKMMDDKDKGDWTLTEGKDYVKHCVVNRKED